MLYPSSRGMSKQTMLDWMRINHPQTPVKSGITKNEVSKMVREMQPEYFPDPNSEAPAVDLTPGTQTPGLFAPLFETSTTPIHSTSSSAQENASVPITAHLEPPPDLESSTNIKVKKKRTASDELNCGRFFKRSDIGDATILPDPSQSRKKDKVLSRPSKPQRTQLKGTNLNRVTSATSMSKSINIPVKIEALVKAENHVPPLIDMSETNWMDSPNPVNGHDIPPIEMPPASVSGKSLKSKSGVEVFQEERRQAQKIRELEDAVEQLRVRMETNEKSDLSALAEEMRQDEAIRLLTVRVGGLEHKIEDIRQLKDSVTNLKSQLTDLCAQMSTIVEDIKVPEEVIKGLMSLDEDDENGSIISSEL
ncbi:uncharacterized protein MELLADRAFT_91904 [Melampsora larici-populina 98AG31]|uniref:Uncharacterized protein n=1 Tax=Melampsora larici-populina (strain 98AG31 / pathotype 3-4-7) TaxID=747676 RepID=F4S0T0_MELLP|nr:uncharacterized protein MELLADRAFT_91904 [Melampsora larici-populina 98AG31]EGG01638.1 hypothetical protein MELLADRAFT_91904 [Melampsora larici-populina 98AG31]